MIHILINDDFPVMWAPNFTPVAKEVFVTYLNSIWIFFLSSFFHKHSRFIGQQENGNSSLPLPRSSH